MKFNKVDFSAEALDKLDSQSQVVSTISHSHWKLMDFDRRKKTKKTKKRYSELFIYRISRNNSLYFPAPLRCSQLPYWLFSNDLGTGGGLR